MATTNRSTCFSAMASLDTSFMHSKLNVRGLIGIATFYVLIFAMGLLAVCRRKKVPANGYSVDVMLAGRNMTTLLGVLTLAGTWVGGDFVVGTAEYLLNPKYGLVWCQAPIYISLSLMLNGFLYAKKMRDAGYVTILDPFKERYGDLMVTLLFLVNLFAEVAFCTIAFSVIGSTLNVIIGLSYLWAVIISAVMCLLYTMIGGLSSVAYTDIIQLIALFLGLLLAIPFAMKHEAVSHSSLFGDDITWLGQLPPGPWILHYIDNALLMLIGAGPWQIYFQRILSLKYAQSAVKLSVIAGFVSLLSVGAPIIIGAIAASTDWNMTGYRDVGSFPMSECDYPLALPLVLRFLTPNAVAVIGLAGVSAASLSSADSVILSTSTMFAQNIYQPISNRIRAKSGRTASDTEVVWVLRLSMAAVALLTTSLAITVKSIVALITICVDLPYVILFPQLICALYMPTTNSYGSLAGYLVSAVLRLTAGEPLLRIKPVVRYPWYDELSQTQRFPYKTMTVVAAFLVTVSVSWISELACRRFALARMLDRGLFGICQNNAIPREDGHQSAERCAFVQNPPDQKPTA